VNALTPYLMPWFSSPTTWYHQHVIGHHSYPNVGHKDPDLAHAPQLMREHVSIKWRPVHKKQHSIWRFGFMWTVAVGLGLHLMADTKLMLQEEYNRVVPAMPVLQLRLAVVCDGLQPQGSGVLGRADDDLLSALHAQLASQPPHPRNGARRMCALLLLLRSLPMP
jgi:hypothetical protein